MSSVFLSQNQRELIKFQKSYVLYSHKKKNRKSNTASILSLSDKVHPAEEALLDFKPDENEIDGKLYEGIVEKPILRKLQRKRNSESQDPSEDLHLNYEEWKSVPARNSRYVGLAPGGLDTEEDESSEYSNSDDESEDEGFEIGGKRGF